MFEVTCNAAAESVLVPVTTVLFKKTSGVVSLAAIVPVRLIWWSLVVTAAVASKDSMIDPVPFGLKVKLPFAPVVMLKAPVSVKALAESVWVEPLMIKPLIVLVAVAPVMAPERFRVVTPEIAPAVETSQVLESIATVEELLPRVVAPVDDEVVKDPANGVA